MKQVFYKHTLLLLSILLTVGFANAQEKDTTIISNDNVKIIVTKDKGDTTKNKDNLGRHSIEISTNGIRYHDATKPKKKHKNLHVGMHFDFGFNNIHDKTNYNGPLSSRNLVVADSITRPLASKDLELRNGKSINFNFWPVWLSQDIAKHNVQIETGLGFQFFNYQYESDVRPIGTSLLDNEPIFADITDPTMLKGKAKNKFGVSYVSIPLMIRFNSNKKKDHRYFVGAGVIGSYKLKSWSKFYGQKESLNYGINDWMTQVTAEIGVTGIIKLYGTYALQSMYRPSALLDRTPFAIGIRL